MPELGAHRSTHPADDLTTALITTNIDGEALTQAELASFFILLLTAGNETTRNAITHGLLALDRAPRPAGPVAGRPGRRRRHRGRRDRALGHAGHLDAPHRHRGHRPVRRGAPRRRQGAAVLQLGQPGRGGVRRPLPLRRPAGPQPAPRVRGRRSPLLPRGPPGPPGDRRDAAGAVRAGCPTSRPPASPTGSTRASSTGSSTCPAGSPRPEAPSRTAGQGFATISTARPPRAPRPGRPTSPDRRQQDGGIGPRPPRRPVGRRRRRTPAVPRRHRLLQPPLRRPQHHLGDQATTAHTTRPTATQPSENDHCPCSWRSAPPRGRAPGRGPGRPS